MGRHVPSGALGSGHPCGGGSPPGPLGRAELLHTGRVRGRPRAARPAAGPAGRARVRDGRRPAEPEPHGRLALRRHARGPGRLAALLAALDEDAREAHAGSHFADLARTEQRDLVRSVQELGPKPWHGLNAAHVWSLWTRYACYAYWSHPVAWSEMGFGGPAYPRGYLRLGVGQREPWEPEMDTEAPPAEPPTRRPVPPGPPVRHSRLRAAAATLAATARSDRDVRERNASAWLPGNEELLPGMRKFADQDEVDLVVVGCGAGERRSPSGWPGPGGGWWCWRRVRSGTPSATGSVTRPAPTICTGPSRGSSTAPTRCRWGPTTPAAAWAVR
ncbi:gluconate 2-dehydrogenase subunit 3 family protein [Streptacidiphilus monticola]